MNLVSRFFCRRTEARKSKRDQTTLSDQTARILALGDSYTIGESVGSGDCWPMQLADSLRQETFRVQEPTLIAKTAWTTADLLKQLASTRLDRDYDMTSVMIGVNNQYQQRSVEEYASELSRLLELAIEHTKSGASHVIVLSIPDWGVTPFAEGRDRKQISDQINSFNLTAQQAAETNGMTWIDVTAISRQAAADTGLLADDGLHPSRSMHRQWANEVLPVADRLLAEFK